MSAVPPVDAGAEATDDLKGPAAGFGVAAAIAILFNTVLAWARTYEPLNAYMASLSGDSGAPTASPRSPSSSSSAISSPTAISASTVCALRPCWRRLRSPPAAASRCGSRWSDRGDGGVQRP